MDARCGTEPWRVRMAVVGLALVALPLMVGATWALAINDADATRVVNDYAEFAELGSLPDDAQMRLEDAVMEAARLSVVEYDVLVNEGIVNSDDALDQIVTRMRERFTEQERQWEGIGPEWRGAFEQIRDRFRLCLDNETPDCLNEYRLMLQYEHARRMEASFQERIGQKPDDGADVFTMQLERSRERIETMLRNGDSETLNRLQITTQEMERLRTRLREQLDSGVNPSSSSSSSSSSTSTPGKGKP